LPRTALRPILSDVAHHGMRQGITLVRGALITVCGLFALFTPLLLWLAWSKQTFWLVLALGCIALLIIYALIWSSPDERF
jgi:hypothetical protein